MVRGRPGDRPRAVPGDHPRPRSPPPGPDPLRRRRDGDRGGGGHIPGADRQALARPLRRTAPLPGSRAGLLGARSRARAGRGARPSRLRPGAARPDASTGWPWTSMRSPARSTLSPSPPTAGWWPPTASWRWTRTPSTATGELAAELALDLEGEDGRTGEDPYEAEAKRRGLTYVHLPGGSIGCIGNGAGLAMNTLDLVQQVGAATQQLPGHRRRGRAPRRCATRSR